MSSSTLRRVLADFGGVYFVNAVVAFIFAASGPVAIILAVGTRGGLAPSDLSSWIAGVDPARLAGLIRSLSVTSTVA